LGTLYFVPDPATAREENRAADHIDDGGQK
jgi:hypothetical protein